MLSNSTRKIDREKEIENMSFIFIVEAKRPK